MSSASGLVLINLDDVIEHRERFFLGALEGVAADDGPVAAAVADGGDFLVDAVEILGFSARENDDPLAVKQDCTTCSIRCVNVLTGMLWAS